LFQHLRERWQDLFQAQFDILLYDLTSTYIEGEGAEIPKAKYPEFGVKNTHYSSPQNCRP